MISEKVDNIMKFRIHHISRFFYWGELVSVFMFFLVCIVCRSLGITLKEKTFALIIMTEIAIMLLLGLLFGIEKIFGATVYIENDRIKVNMIFRQKKIYFNDISDIDYSSYITNNRFNPDEAEKNPFVLFGRRSRQYTRFKLVVTLSSGKIFVLNDTKNYYSDENVGLYKVYQCCKAILNERM